MIHTSDPHRDCRRPRGYRGRRRAPRRSFFYAGLAALLAMAVA